MEVGQKLAIVTRNLGTKRLLRGTGQQGYELSRQAWHSLMVDVGQDKSQGRKISRMFPTVNSYGLIYSAIYTLYTFLHPFLSFTHH